MSNPFKADDQELEGLQINRINSVRRDCEKLWDKLDKMAPGRYGSLAKTQLEQVFSWAELGIKSTE